MRPRAGLRFARRGVRAEATGGVSATDPVPEIQRVAREHAPEGGYGDTAYNASEGTVAWIPADWTSDEELDAAHSAFLEIDGVNGVMGLSEASLPSGDDWQHVWPVPGSEEAYERVLAVAKRPLGLSFSAMVPASAHYRPATVPNRNCGTCAYFDGERCTMFSGKPTVQADMVCDEWSGNESRPVESEPNA